MDENDISELEDFNVCSLAVNYLQSKKREEAWVQSTRGDWLVFALGFMDTRLGWPGRKTACLCACDCVETGLSFVLEVGRASLQSAINTVRDWCGENSTVTTNDLSTLLDSFRASSDSLRNSEETKTLPSTAIVTAVSFLLDGVHCAATDHANCPKRLSRACIWVAEAHIYTTPAVVIKLEDGSLGGTSPRPGVYQNFANIVRSRVPSVPSDPI